MAGYYVCCLSVRSVRLRISRRWCRPIYFVLNAEVHDYNTRASTYMFLVLEVLLDKGVLDIKEVCYGIDYLLD